MKYNSAKSNVMNKLIDDDMARQRKQIYAQGNALVRKFYMCTETVRMSLFKSYCSSLYTSALWCNYCWGVHVSQQITHVS